MKKIILQYLLLWSLFILIFILYRTLFITYNWSIYQETPFRSLLLSYVYGLKLDLSFIGYLMVIPSVFMCMASFIKPKLTRYFIFSYLSLILCIISLIELIDMEVYTHWGEKFDVMHLLYLRKPTQITN